MPRYFIRISFKGTRFAGWQKQKNALSVQEVLDHGLSVLFGNSVETTGCGRTDTGVHSSLFYAHFDAALRPGDLTDTVYRLNAILPDDIAVHEFIPVHDSAHARYDATSRRYRYFVTGTKDPFLKEFTCFFPQSLDVHAMNSAAALLTGRGDFASFSKSRSGTKTTVCIIFQAEWKQQATLEFSITADRFLRGMVRAIVGTMFEVGRGKKDPAEIEGILYARDRSKAGATAPASGLYLSEINYPYITKPAISGMPFSL